MPRPDDQNHTDRIVFRDIAPEDLPDLRDWFEDAELSRRLSFPTTAWFAYVTAGSQARCWIAARAGVTMAFIQVDRENSALGHIDLAMRPDIRGQGIGTAVLSAFLSGPGLSYDTLQGHVMPDNMASIACFRRCGFDIGIRPDADGFIALTYRSRQSS